MLAACNGAAMIAQQQQQHQAQLQPMLEQQHQLQQQQQQQQFPYNTSTYPGTQMYEGWQGMALKQIMGQIDLLNFQNPNCNNPAKWPLNKDFINNNNNNNGYLDTQCGENRLMQQQQQQNLFKSSGYDCGQMDNDSSSAWLGPQLWNRRIGVDVAANETSNHSTASEQLLFDNIAATAATIKTELASNASPDIDLSEWYNVDINVDKGLNLLYFFPH